MSRVGSPVSPGGSYVQLSYKRCFSRAGNPVVDITNYADDVDNI